MLQELLLPYMYTHAHTCTHTHTHTDVEHMLHEEQSTNREEGWKFMNRTEFVEVWRKSEPDKPVHLIKVCVQPFYPAACQLTTKISHKACHAELADSKFQWLAQSSLC